METNHLNWNKNEFQTYLLLYCASADLSQGAEELHFIKEHVEKSDFRTIHKVFNNDTDYQSLKRVQEYVKHHNLSSKELTDTFKEVKILFKIDGEYDSMEKHLLNMLKSLLE
ncbi:hypothetical protein JCM19314_1584 [Nonlabens ulvanivorans]|uniref:Co-chaperone DjlA N-terminal domain-containing protein n=1 Tax=Nonlabens ulvanivorans TaxID=906888 RepID=A0A090QG63_NONUL|nr:hypothetical protein [Nonlabens ulvanivorans]GAL01911.1 hypothetical protein JCM19314_1584 [Nonlabens ulvanivorans]